MGGIILLTVLLPIVALAGTILGAMLVVPTLLFKPLFDITLLLTLLLPIGVILSPLLIIPALLVKPVFDITVLVTLLLSIVATIGTIFASLVALPTLLVKPVFDITVLFKMFELDSVVLILILIYLIVRRSRENSEPTHNTITNNSSKLLSLPDELFIEIMSLLNQLDKMSLSLVSKRLNSLARVSLLRVIYVNNGGPRILIRREFNTLFYLNHTIITEMQFKELLNSDKIHNVKKIEFFSDIVSYKNLELLSKSNVVVTFEHKEGTTLTNLKGKLSANGFSVLDVNDFLLKEASTSTNLSIDCSGITVFRKISPKLILKSLKLRHINLANLLLYHNFEPIDVKKVFLGFEEKTPSIIPVAKIFKLNKIESLEISFETKPSEVEMLQFMSQLVSLKHLSIMSQNFRFDRALNSLEPNSLESFHVIVMGRYDTFLAQIVAEILKNQSESIGRICWSNRRLNVRQKTYGLNDFERVYNVDAVAKDQDIAEIRTLFSNGFSHLKNVILNESHYKVDRKDSHIDVVLIN